MSAERGGMAMTHDGVGHVQTFPSGYSSAQTKLGVVGVGEEVLVETTDLVKHRSAIHGGATVRPDDFLETIVLSAVDLPRAASTVLSIEVNKVSYFIDACRVFVGKDFRRGHAEAGTAFENGFQRVEPTRMSLGVIVKQGNEFAC